MIKYLCPHLNIVQTVEQWRLFHAKIVRYQGVEAIGEIQYLRLCDTV